VYTELFGIANSSAAFGVGMTRTIEQGEPESFSANPEAKPFQSLRSFVLLSSTVLENLLDFVGRESIGFF